MTGSTSKCGARQYSDQMMCNKCGKCWDMNDPDPPECGKIPPYFEEPEMLPTIQEYIENQPTVKKPHVKNTTAMIGFLAAKLACYEPNNSTVQEAIKYLEDEI